MHIIYEPSPAVRRNITDLYGERGIQWLAGFGGRLEAVAGRWKVAFQNAFDSASYCFTAPGVLPTGQEVVVKIGFPEPAFFREVETLRQYNGSGAVQLFDFDRQNAAMLLECCLPGNHLDSLPSDDAAVSAAAKTIQGLHIPAPQNHTFPHVRDWAGGFGELRQRYNGGSGPIPALLLTKAEGIYQELSQPGPGEVLLHGDLHHGNILASQRQPWLAIDPKGVIGPADYEVGAFVRNPVPHIVERPDLPGVLNRRIDRFAEILGYSRERLIGWAGAQAVLAACWELEDRGRGWERWIILAQAIFGLD